jgi:hypothetical protein
LNGFKFLLGLHEASYLENNEGSLLSTNQFWEAGVWLADVLRRHGGDQRLVAPVENSEEMLDMDLQVKDGLLAIECSYPSNDELHDLPRVWLTGNEVPWDPTILDEEGNIKVLLCWDGESEFEEAKNNDVKEQDERNQFEDYILRMQKATKFFIQTLCMITCGNAIYQACANVMEKATSASTAIKEHDYEILWTLLGWLPLEVVKRTLGCTTQLAMGSLTHLPFRWHHKSRPPPLNVPRLAEIFATDM